MTTGALASEGTPIQAPPQKMGAMIGFREFKVTMAPPRARCQRW
jgi:hypothetical protein